MTTDADWQIDIARRLGELSAHAEESTRAYSDLRADVRDGFDRLADVLAAHAKKDEDMLGLLERRVRSLEKFRMWIVGIATGIGSLLGAVRALLAWRG